ncbi:hypothetical protein [Cellulomonas sp. URHD0024]|uniref:hypothetical protein n=1 Tax=Cellulomonas sp. URHD0024 TaxID=1302620 RepID=UPI0004100D45|nr:hypothetical protein [Cellulomonas sp. URHD0024]
MHPALSRSARALALGLAATLALTMLPATSALAGGGVVGATSVEASDGAGAGSDKQALATISGSLVLPDPSDRSDQDAYSHPMTVQAVALDASLPAVAPVDLGGDSTFVVAGLVPGASYRLQLSDGAGVLGGWFAGGGQHLVREPSASAPVSAPTHGLIAMPGEWSSIAGTVELSAGFVHDESAPLVVSASHHHDGDFRSITDTATVAADGAYALEHLAPGEAYSLRLEDPTASHPELASGWVTATGVVDDARGSVDVEAPAGGVVVHPSPAAGAAARHADALDSHVEGAATLVTISGSVVMPAGAGPAGVNVGAYRWDASANFWELVDSRYSSGETFSIDGLDPAVSYRLRLFGQMGYVGGWWAGAGQPLVREPGAAVDIAGGRSGLELHPRAAAAMTVSVRPPLGATIGLADGVYIYAWTDATNWGNTPAASTSVPVGDHVDFTLAGMDPQLGYRFQVGVSSGPFVGGYYAGSPQLVATYQDAVVVSVPSSVQVSLRPAVSISGTLLLPTGYTPGTMQVGVTSSTPGLGGGFQTVVKAADGSYRFSVGRLDGAVAYRLQFWENDGGGVYGNLLPGYYSADGSPLADSADGAASIVGGRSGVVVKPTTGQTISGRLSLPAGYTPPNGSSGPQMSAESTTVSYVANAQVSANGSFAVRRVRPGSALLWFNDGPGGIVDGRYAGQDKPLQHAWWVDGTPVSSGQTGLRAVAQAASSVLGSLTRPADPAGDGGHDGGVSVVDAASGHIVAQGWSPSDAYQVDEVPSGSFKIGFNRESGFSLYTGTFYKPGASDGPVRLADADVVPVGIGEVVDGIDGHLTTCATVSGTIEPGLIPDGAVGKVTVYNDDDPNLVSRTSELVAGGPYTVTGLLDGSYHVALGYWPSSGSGATDFTEVSQRDVVIPGCEDVAGINLVAMPSLTSTVTPTVSGTAKVGSTLTATAGTWSPAATTVSYQWLGGGGEISGATASTYTVTGAEAGAPVSVRVTASRSGYLRSSVTSAATAAVSPGTIMRTAKPTVAGAAKVGTKLTATPGTWSPAGTTPAYQWLRGGVAISGATSSTYTLAAADLGTAVSVRVTALKIGYTSVTATSATTATVLVGTITNTVKPVISGSAKVGAKLTSSTGTWSPTTVTRTYQWLRNGAVITGATASTYSLALADLGATVSLRVTAKKSGFTTLVVTSAATAKVTAGSFVNTVKPTVSGTAKVGYTLTAIAGTWSPNPTTVTYQWLRSGVAISGATASTYRLTASDLAKAVAVKVVVSRTGYVTRSATSTATAAVAAGTITTKVSPVVTGTPKVGSTLTVTPGTWTPTGTTVTYQWLRSGVAISGATAASYKLTSASTGTAVSVRVTVRRTGYTTRSVTTAALTIS